MRERKHVYSSHLLARALLDLPDGDVHIADRWFSEDEDVNTQESNVAFAELYAVEHLEHSTFWDDSTFWQIVLVPETRDEYV